MFDIFDKKKKASEPGRIAPAPLGWNRAAPASESTAPKVEEPKFTRRRLGGVVHDQRGMATLLWASDEDGDVRNGTASRRVPLRLVDDDKAAGKRKPTDLRKLGEWIKTKRELEARAARGETEDD